MMIKKDDGFFYGDKSAKNFRRQPSTSKINFLFANRLSKASLYGYLTPLVGGLGIMVCCSQAQAAILSDSTAQKTAPRIQIRSGSVTHAASTNAIVMSQPRQVMSEDSLQALIQQKQLEANVSIEENKRVNVKPTSTSAISRYPQPSFGKEQYQTVYYNSSVTADFNSWLARDRYRAQEVANYQRYLSQQLGAYNVPPMSQLLTTARSWDKCGYEPFQLPPEYLWANVVPTLRLYSELKRQGILPASTEIRSVYRSPGLNTCAGGAAGSKHLTAGAIDIWVPEFEGNSWQLSNLQEGLCQFWQYQGVNHDFGLGLYATGAIHLDTQGYRKWGFEHSTSTFCRY